MDDKKINYVPYGGKPVETLNGYPPNSPDLNPIENVFSYWDKQVSERKPQNIDELIKIVKGKWPIFHKILFEIVFNVYLKLWNGLVCTMVTFIMNNNLVE